MFAAVGALIRKMHVWYLALIRIPRTRTTFQASPLDYLVVMTTLTIFNLCLYVTAGITVCHVPCHPFFATVSIAGELENVEVGRLGCDCNVVL